MEKSDKNNKNRRKRKIYNPFEQSDFIGKNKFKGLLKNS